MALVKQEVEEVNLSSANALMRPEQTNDSLDSFIRQAIGKEPFLSFSRTGDSPVQWIQLLQALDHQDQPGWPLFSPVKIQLQKCDKCSREFCSTINYRRHIRLHRRALNLDRDFTIRNREFLRAFWDKLPSEEAMEIVSFEDVFLEEVPGSSIIQALTLFIRRPGFSSLPPAYMKAGTALLELIQARPSRFPVMSEELFSILDDASEKTFLCAGKAENLQKFVFDGEAGKIGLEMRNVVGCTSFLIEQKLVKAWLADKDAESLRNQKLLVEEEEAFQKRQADIVERKRLKKLRHKEQKVKTPISEGDVPSSPPDPLPLESNTSLIELSSSDTVCSVVEDKVVVRNERAHTNNSHKLHRGSNGFHVKGSKQRDSRNKVWTPKPKQVDEAKNLQVLIGSISVAIKEEPLRTIYTSDLNPPSSKGNTVFIEDGQPLRFSSCDAEAFLAQRWKEAIESDHTELVVVQETKPSRFAESEKECSLNHDKENQVGGASEIKCKYRPQFEGVNKVRYIPKQRSVT